MNEERVFPVLADVNADFYFIMDDDSMKGAGICAGDIVALVACDHAENGQIVAVQVGSTVLLRRLVCNGLMLTSCTACGVMSPTWLDELPGAKIVGVAVEVRRILTPAGSPKSPRPQNDPQGVQK